MIIKRKIINLVHNQLSDFIYFKTTSHNHIHLSQPYFKLLFASSILIISLYLQVLSPLHGAPVLIYYVPNATTK